MATEVGGTPGPTTPQRDPKVLILAVLAVISVIGLAIIVLTRDSGSSDGDVAIDPQTTTPPEDTDPPEDADPPEDIDPPEDTDPPDAEPSGGTDIGIQPPFPPEGSAKGQYVDEPRELGDGLVLKEYGVSTVVYESFTGDELRPTFGLVLENTGDEIMQGVELQVTFYDEDDIVIDTEEPRVQVIQPGETLGIGYQAFTSGEVDRYVRSIEVNYQGQSPFPQEIGSGTLEIVELDVDLDLGNGSFSNRFEISSTYDYDLENPQTHLIYRNADGEIWAGDLAYKPDYIPAGGANRGELNSHSNHNPLNLDPDNVDAYGHHGHGSV